MQPKQGDILLIPIPFTDLSSHKLRPVIVVSNNEYNRKTADIIVVALTSQPARGEYAFQITTSDLTSGRLQRPSEVRCDKICTLAQAIAVRHFGRVSSQVIEQIRERLGRITQS